MTKEFDRLATALFGLYWADGMVPKVLTARRAKEIKAGAEPTMEEQRALVHVAFEKRGEISEALRAVQSNVLKALGVEAE